ncbi:(R)-stereoselective amidase [Wickerhamiella sorbophila]|uniref:(R)-stereoselective amidase n=1 Tax=Wickerhamiella sorbophila TaxID=45607 RepID=A0A2T0FEG7_9ASCO|nr:(R)-stereoselective amidase [Wickerhamiella sorbophila]PRT53393.1 (R)-stereoselective amidase [Wickerhamiella sorbophila]
MTQLKLELVQQEIKDGDIDYNVGRIVQAIEKCSSEVDIIVFSEVAMTGFLTPANVDQLALSLDSEPVKKVAQALEKRGIAGIMGLTEREGDKLFNTAVFIKDGSVFCKYQKTHLWLGDRGVVQAGDRFVAFDHKGVRIGLIICFDSEFPETSRALAELEVDLIVICDGNMEPYGHLHQTSVKARAQENQVFVAMVNRIGVGEDKAVYHGNTSVVDPEGHTQFMAGSIECKTIISIDANHTARARKDFFYSSEKRFKFPGEIVDHEKGWKELIIPHST